VLFYQQHVNKIISYIFKSALCFAHIFDIFFPLFLTNKKIFLERKIVQIIVKKIADVTFSKMQLVDFSSAYNGFLDGNNNDRNFMLDI